MNTTSWRLYGFGDALDDWRRRETPPDRLVDVVIRWSLTRADDPYVGMRREPDFDNLWFGAIPGTVNGDKVVACSYRVHEREHRVVCDSYATLHLPL